jgi:hypothetical protein
MRKVVPISLVITVALLGCTLNRTPGNGQPVTATPSMSPVSTPGTSYGNNPMSSSYVEPSSTTGRSEQAAAIMREHQLYQPRFLGYLNPEPRTQQPNAPVYETGQFINPSLYANPQLTINSSISSQPNPVISSGTADVTLANGTTGAFVLPGGAGTTNTSATPSGTTAASTVLGTTTTPMPGTLAAAATRGVGTLTPTLTSGGTPSPNVAVSPFRGMASSTLLGNATTATTGTTTVLTTGTATTAPLTVTTTPTGAVMISNARH